MHFNLGLTLLNFYMYWITWHGDRDQNLWNSPPCKYSVHGTFVNDKSIFVSAVEISCLAHGTCIGYSSPLTLTDNVRFEKSMSASGYGNTNMSIFQLSYVLVPGFYAKFNFLDFLVMCHFEWCTKFCWLYFYDEFLLQHCSPAKSRKEVRVTYLYWSQLSWQLFR